MLDWDDLRIFHVAAQHGSLNRAAAALDVHRSTVLRRIERLEARIGGQVFERGPEGIVLTAAGERLLTHTERIAEETSGLAESAVGNDGRPAGAIRVGTTFNLAFGILPRVVAAFREAYPEITIDLIATPDGYAPLRPDDTDIGFRTLEPGTAGHDQMVGRRLGRLPVAIYGGQAYLEANRPPASLDDLERHRLVLGTENLSHIASFRRLEDGRGTAEPVYRVSSMLLMLAAVRDGLGLACLPRYLGDSESRLRRVLDLPVDLSPELWILRHPHHRDTARVRAFSEYVSHAIPDLL